MALEQNFSTAFFFKEGLKMKRFDPQRYTPIATVDSTMRSMGAMQEHVTGSHVRYSDYQQLHAALVAAATILRKIEMVVPAGLVHDIGYFLATIGGAENFSGFDKALALSGKVVGDTEEPELCKSLLEWVRHAARAEIGTLQNALASTREALAGTDYGSPPSDYETTRMARTIRADHDKYRDQVIDTCKRAENAEAELAAARNLLAVAACPTCDDSGNTLEGEQCEWCDGRAIAITYAAKEK